MAIGAIGLPRWPTVAWVLSIALNVFLAVALLRLVGGYVARRAPFVAAAVAAFLTGASEMAAHPGAVAGLGVDPRRARGADLPGRLRALARGVRTARRPAPVAPIVPPLRILITGGAGMLGRKLAERLSLDATLGGQSVARLTLADLVEPSAPARRGSRSRRSWPTSPSRASPTLFSGPPRRNFPSRGGFVGRGRGGLRRAIASISTARASCSRRPRAGPGYRPRVVFASTIAVFGAPFPDAIGDEFCRPR